MINLLNVQYVFYITIIIFSVIIPIFYARCIYLFIYIFIFVKDTLSDFFTNNHARTETTMWKSSLKTFSRVGILIGTYFLQIPNKYKIPRI